MPHVGCYNLLKPIFLSFCYALLPGTNVEKLFSFVTDQLKAGGSVRCPVHPQFSQEDLAMVEAVLKATSDCQRLRVSAASSAEEIGRAYRKLAAFVHPDKNKAPESETAFKLLVS